MILAFLIATAFCVLKVVIANLHLNIQRPVKVNKKKNNGSTVFVCFAGISVSDIIIGTV